MQFQYTPYILPLVASTIISDFVTVYAWRQRAYAAGAMTLVILSVACGMWSFGYALEIAGADLPTKIFWGKSQYLGIVTVPLAWFLFANSHSTRGFQMTPRRVAVLSIVPAITLLLALTTETHGLIWEDVDIKTVGSFSALDVTHGVWFWVYWFYSQLLILAGTILVIRSFLRMKGMFRWQDFLLLIAVLAPWVGNLIYVLGISPIPHLDFTPFAFSISVIAFAWGISSFKLINLTPVARDLVIEKMPDGMIVLDAQGYVVDINLSVQEALGVSTSQVIGLHSRDVFGAWPSLLERYENTLEALDEIVIGEGESQQWFELRMSPLHGVRDRLLGRVVTVRNITETKQTEALRQQAEEALRLSEQKYRSIYEQVEDVIYETDNQGHLTSISPSIVKQGGYRPEEVIGRSVTEFFVYPEQYAALDELMIKNGSVNDFEALLKRKDGTTRFTSITSHIVIDADGQPVATEGVLRDITERKQAEERIKQMNAELEQRVNERTSQLQESNTYLTTLIESSIALNESLDLNAILDRILVQAHKLVPARAINIMFVNGEHASIVRHIGYQGLEMIEENLLNFRYPINWPTFHQMMTTRKSIHISDTAKEAGWQNIEGSEWVRSCIGVPLVNSDETIGFLNASHSEPDFFEEKHRAMLESLAHHASVAIQNARLIAELKKALEKEQGMRDQLVQADKLAALGKMAAAIAHEINNPIQTFKNTFYLLDDQIPQGSPAREYLKLATVEANRISDLVAQMRSTYATGSKAKVRVDVPTLLAEVHDLLAPQLKERQVEWQQDRSLESYTVCGVPNTLKQVFINLCLNAIEAMETNHGGRITVNLRTDPDGRRIGVDFHNTGPLITEEDLPHIFEPFFTTKGSGFGLGLSISYDIIRQHEGEIRVESVPGKGVTITVWLPLATDGNEEGGL